MAKADTKSRRFPLPALEWEPTRETREEFHRRVAAHLDAIEHASGVSTQVGPSHRTQMRRRRLWETTAAAQDRDELDVLAEQLWRAVHAAEPELTWFKAPEAERTQFRAIAQVVLGGFDRKPHPIEELARRLWVEGEAGRTPAAYGRLTPAEDAVLLRQARWVLCSLPELLELARRIPAPAAAS